jgi:hypothetical protein
MLLRGLSVGAYTPQETGGTTDEYSMAEAIGFRCDIGDTDGMRD